MIRYHLPHYFTNKIEGEIFQHEKFASIKPRPQHNQDYRKC